MQDKNDLIAQKTYNLYISESMEGSNSTWNFDKNEKIYSVIFKLPNYVSRLRSPRYQRESRKNPQSQGYPLIPGMKIRNRRVIYLFGATAAGFRDIPKIPGIKIYFLTRDFSGFTYPDPDPRDFLGFGTREFQGIIKSQSRSPISGIFLSSSKLKIPNPITGIEAILEIKEKKFVTWIFSEISSWIVSEKFLILIFY